MEDKRTTMPVIALRGLTVLPRMTLNFDIIRGKSIAAVEKAMVADQKVFLVTQIKQEKMTPEYKDLYHIGTVGVIRQLVKMPGGTIRITVEGKEKAELLELNEEGEALTGEVEFMEPLTDDLSDVEKEAMLRILKEKLEEYGTLNVSVGKELLPGLTAIFKLEELLQQLSIQFSWDFEEKQQLLEYTYLSGLYERVLKMLLSEIEVYKIKKEFQEKVKTAIDENQKNYILKEQLKAIREELGEDSSDFDIDELKEQLRSLKADKSIKEKILKEINRYGRMPSGSQDANVLRTYLETVLELPWNKTTKEYHDLKRAEKILNQDHYGLECVKERILEYLAVKILTKKGNSPILCLVGPPGTGKTSIARSVARALGKKYVRISLGGVHDEAEIRGHRKTYVGAMPGRIVEGLKQAGVSNPLMLLDEIDKASSDYKGDTSSALLEVLDSEQNVHFRDHYVELPINLSEVLFIATANTTQSIPGPLLDRMELIEVNSYTENEKFHIGKDYLIPKQLEQNGLNKEQLFITDKALEKMIHHYTREAGVRNLERKIGEVCRKSVREILEGKKQSIRITERNLEKYLGKEKILFEDANKENQVGIVRGLAWTSVGGDTLQIEVNTMPGKGELLLTGQLGDIMKESAKTALTYVRSIASSDYQVDEKYFSKHDIHIHIPEGAVPKDGPSAGITMAAAMLSAVTGRTASAKVAMTGEITLRGRVLPIGGLKEKLLAAKMAHMEKVLVPEKNRPDVEEISKEITRGMKLVFVKEMKEVLKETLLSDSNGGKNDN